MTGGYLRLLEIPGLGLPINEYPPPDARARWGDRGPAADAP